MTQHITMFRLGNLPPAARRWWTLAALCFALFMTMLDNMVVNVALPAIRHDLGAGATTLEWVVSGYVLSFAVLLLTGGRLADRFGRRRIFLLGLAVFTVSSLACGLAPSAAILVGARVVQGAGGALMTPATLAIIVATFPPAERPTAIGIWSGVSATALALGPVIGGLLTDSVGWNWVFFVNVPVGVVAIAFGIWVVPESRSEGARGLDVAGLATAGVAVLALVVALIEGGGWGWASPATLGLLTGSAVAAAAFVGVELRIADPMLDLRLLRSRAFAGGNTVLLLFTFAAFGAFFYLSLYLQEVGGRSAIVAGLAWLPWFVPLILLAPFSGVIARRLGTARTAAVGMGLITAAFAVFSRVTPDSSLWFMLPGMLCGGVGAALTVAPVTAATLAGVAPERGGVAAGMINTARQIGGALGIAVVGAVVQARGGAAVASPATSRAAFTAGLDSALLVVTALLAVGTLTAALTLRTRPRATAAACLDRFESRDLRQAQAAEDVEESLAGAIAA